VAVVVVVSAAGAVVLVFVAAGVVPTALVLQLWKLHPGLIRPLWNERPRTLIVKPKVTLVAGPIDQPTATWFKAIAAVVTFTAQVAGARGRGTTSHPINSTA
jgi:hypothetical protein